jgi:hypothetical protein
MYTNSLDGDRMDTASPADVLLEALALAEDSAQALRKIGRVANGLAKEVAALADGDTT